MENIIKALKNSKKGLTNIAKSLGASERPELEEAEEAAQTGISRARDKLPKNKDVSVDVAWSTDPNLAEHMGGAAPNCESDSEIKITVNPEADDWKTSVLNAAVHGYAHAFYYENIDLETHETWDLILEEAFALLIEEWLVSEYEHAWWRREFSKSDLQRHWLKMEEELDKERNTKSDPQYLTEEGFNAFYPLCYMIGEELFKGHDIGNFPNIREHDIEKAGNKLFNQ